MSQTRYRNTVMDPLRGTSDDQTWHHEVPKKDTKKNAKKVSDDQISTGDQVVDQDSSTSGQDHEDAHNRHDKSEEEGAHSNTQGADQSDNDDKDKQSDLRSDIPARGAPPAAFMPFWGRSTYAAHKNAKKMALAHHKGGLAGFPDFLMMGSGSHQDHGGIGEGKTSWGVSNDVLQNDLFDKSMAPKGKFLWTSKGQMPNLVRQVSISQHFCFPGI